jgi:hypothetical protein
MWQESPNGAATNRPVLVVKLQNCHDATNVGLHALVPLLLSLVLLMLFNMTTSPHRNTAAYLTSGSSSQSKGTSGFRGAKRLHAVSRPRPKPLGFFEVLNN